MQNVQSTIFAIFFDSIEMRRKTLPTLRETIFWTYGAYGSIDIL